MRWCRNNIGYQIMQHARAEIFTKLLTLYVPFCFLYKRFQPEITKITTAKTNRYLTDFRLFLSRFLDAGVKGKKIPGVRSSHAQTKLVNIQACDDRTPCNFKTCDGVRFNGGRMQVGGGLLVKKRTAAYNFARAYLTNG